MAQLEDIVEPLFIYSGDAPDDLLITHYIGAARRFFTDTRAWREDVATTAVGATTNQYDLTVPADSEAFDFHIPENNNIPLTKLTREQQERQNYSLGGTPESIRLGSLSEVIIMPDPGTDISANLTIRAVLRPTRTAATLPDDLVDQFAEFIEYGALERLLRTPGESWTDFPLSRYYRGLFEDAIGVQTSRASRGMMNGVRQAVRYGGY